MLQYIGCIRRIEDEGVTAASLNCLTFYTILGCFLVRCAALSTILQSFDYRKVVSNHEGVVVYNENKAA